MTPLPVTAGLPVLKSTVPARLRPSLPVLLLLLSACSAVTRPDTSVDAIVASSEVARRAERAAVDSIVARLARRAVARGDNTLDLLYLSGGGQQGAYGAGFLGGWRARPDSSFPRFDLVTGISTGALQASFALIGTQAALDSLAMLYRGAADRGLAPSVDLFFWLRKTGGVVDTEGYEQALRGIFDTALAARLRAEFRQDRQVAIGTTDFDLGIGRTWDMAAELGATVRGPDRVRKLLLAATAIPGVFPTQLIDGRVQSDGGVVSNILPVLGLDEYRRLGARLRQAGVTEPVTVRVWVVLNLWTHARPIVTSPADRGKMNQRAALLMFWTHQAAELEQLATLAAAVTTGLPGLRMELRITAPPAGLAAEAPPEDKLIDEEWMRRLEQLGRDRALGTSPWDPIPSAFERP
ncbi:MAG: patatin-like phospholipase family protein [Gemmatimonadales bacterium]